MLLYSVRDIMHLLKLNQELKKIEDNMHEIKEKGMRLIVQKAFTMCSKCQDGKQNYRLAYQHHATLKEKHRRSQRTNEKII